MDTPKSFNPRAREGRDSRLWQTTHLSRAFQPTRPRGARRDYGTLNAFHALFQPTRPRGARLSGGVAVNDRVKFQPTRPRGARLRALRLQARPSCFNPRAREGRDSMVSAVPSGSLAFQPTRPRGARQLVNPRRILSRFVSTHAPARGATVSAGDDVDWVVGFNPRAREGRDQSYF